MTARRSVTAVVSPRPVRWRVAAGLTALAALALLGGCGEKEREVGDAAMRPVGVAKAESSTLATTIRLTGDIQAQTEIGVGFRIGGKVTERPVNVGDKVTAGQFLARLDPQTIENDVRAAQAALEAAIGEVDKTQNVFDRQDRLMEQGFTTRPRFDQALAALEAAKAKRDDAAAQLELARDRLGFTELRADEAGVVTARSVEPGEVVQAGQIILRLARDDGRDAVFDVPAALLEKGSDGVRIRVAAASDPAIGAYGTIREVSPQADPVTRTFRVRVGLINPPEALRLGTAVTGSVELASNAVVSIPASALTIDGRQASVWVVDPVTSVVSLRHIGILRFESDRVVIDEGLDAGDVVVSQGIQALHPGQRVAPLSAAPAPAGSVGATLLTAPGAHRFAALSAAGEPVSAPIRQQTKALKG